MKEILIGIFFILLIVSRILGEKAYKLLNAEEKAKIMDGFSGMRAFALIPLFLIIGLFWFAAKYSVLNEKLIFYGYPIALIVYLAVIHNIVTSKFKKLEFKEEFIKKYLFSRLISYVGIAVLFLVILL